MKMKSLATPKTKTFTITHVTFPRYSNGSLHYENNKQDNTYIKMGNPPTRKVVGWAIPSYISQQKVIVSHLICEIICNMKKIAH